MNGKKGNGKGSCQPSCFQGSIWRSFQKRSDLKKSIARFRAVTRLSKTSVAVRSGFLFVRVAGLKALHQETVQKVTEAKMNAASALHQLTHFLGSQPIHD